MEPKNPLHFYPQPAKREEEKGKGKRERREEKEGRKEGIQAKLRFSRAKDEFLAPLQVINATLTRFLPLIQGLRDWGEKWVNPRIYFGWKRVGMHDLMLGKVLGTPRGRI